MLSHARAPRAHLICCFLLALGASAQAETTLYDDDAPLAVTLTAPLELAYDDRDNSERPYFDGTWRYTAAAGETVELQVGIRARGNFRRDNCRYVPLQLNFKKSEVRDTLFAGQDKLKLVGPCGPGKRFQDWLMLEYLAYRSYALLTERHFRTRLLELTYADSGGGKPRTSYAFVIESDGDMARRLQSVLVDESVSPSRLDDGQSALVEVFQFFIGNNDYSTSRAPPGRSCCHNSRLLDDGDPDTGLTPVPYDFDHAGIVDAKYARPPDNVPTTSVTERYFTGLCKADEQVWQDAFDAFRRERAAIVALFGEAQLSNRSRREALRYIERFYNIIDDPAWARADIIEACRTL